MKTGRAFEPQHVAKMERDGSVIHLRCPTVGHWREAPAQGSLVQAGFTLGFVETLGVLHRIVAPQGAVGVVVAREGNASAPGHVAYGDVLLTLDLEAATGSVSAAAAAAEADAATGLAFRSPLAGRFYGRPSPDQPPFVKPGDTVTVGQTVALLEVMKTFNRVTYGGDGLPESATVVEVVPENESDLDQGDVILRLE
ncbi:MAG: biotin/lipoyl-containing protein [Myxococcota bacterium]